MARGRGRVRSSAPTTETLLLCHHSRVSQGDRSFLAVLPVPPRPVVTFGILGGTDDFVKSAATRHSSCSRPNARTPRSTLNKGYVAQPSHKGHLSEPVTSSSLRPSSTPMEHGVHRLFSFLQHQRGPERTVCLGWRQAQLGKRSARKRACAVWSGMGRKCP